MGTNGLPPIMAFIINECEGYFFGPHNDYQEVKNA